MVIAAGASDAAQALLGKTLREARLGDASGLMVLGVVRDGTAGLLTGPEVELRPGDILTDIDGQRVSADLAAGRVVVVAGFQGVDESGSITTLGRGGSDTTAVALAAALKADECQIFTDVDGVYTNNPPYGAFRGFGAPQALFAAEMQMGKRD